jgi:hypothetical protein
MYGCTTEAAFRRHRRATASREGSALVGAMVVFVGIAGLVAASVALSTVEVEQSRDAVDKVRSRFVSEAGVEAAIATLQEASQLADSLEPLGGIASLFAADGTMTPFVGQPLMSGASRAGEYSVTMNLVSLSDATAVIDITSTGYLPAAPEPGGRPVDDWSATAVRVQFNLAPAEVFNYAYFINNWGWLYGNSIYVLGNVRSNGQYDSAGYAPTITGQPTYEGLEYYPAADGQPASVDLLGYKDDNKDGLLDGEDGGIWSGWDIANSQNVKGNGGQSKAQHDFQGVLEMPNLSDLSPYKAKAISEGGTVSIAGTTYVQGVLGDDKKEKKNLYLYGTKADPIVIDGPIVAEGDVVIHGYVTGQGAIYAGGNVYIPDSVMYLNPPADSRPSGNTEAETEVWMAENWDKDFLGLFSAESIVVGDYTNSTWKYYVSSWMNSNLNKSEEDAGEDGIPNTKAGKDGILGTSDDDLLEDDGVWTVEYYSQSNEDMGLLPDGFDVGDVIPGTGEDIDGDGQYDDASSYSDLPTKTPVKKGQFVGNHPQGAIAKYSSIASMYANQIDAVLYTNHSFSWAVFGGQPAEINGALICRNENIVYGTPSISLNYDTRLLGGNSSMAADLLPRILTPPQIVRWTQLDFDPNLILVKP